LRIAAECRQGSRRFREDDLGKVFGVLCSDDASQEVTNARMVRVIKPLKRITLFRHCAAPR
jgi:hypothetical protein